MLLLKSMLLNLREALFNIVDLIFKSQLSAGVRMGNGAFIETKMISYSDKAVSNYILYLAQNMAVTMDSYLENQYIELNMDVLGNSYSLSLIKNGRL